MPGAETISALALFAVATRELLWLAAFAILLSNLDDLAVDLLWVAARTIRRAPLLPPAPPVSGYHAILIPAWDESAVIGAMLRRLLATLDHPDYVVFVGTYPNDPATIAAVDAVGNPRIHRVLGVRPGPTTKADCLNAAWRGMCDHERTTGRRFTSVVLHDAEDILHPDELTVFDCYMPALAMVQLPVLPLPDRGSRWISGHYLDEFAQNHGKDMVVRGLLGAPVPSAGVATAIDREALARLGGDAPFDPTSLTEDYEIGTRLHRMGLRGRLVRHRLRGVLVATAEYFPADLEAAVRQKSRWLIGIALAGWDRLGWHGDWTTCWMLLRDRKGLFTAGLGLLAYALVALTVGQFMVRALLSETTGATLPPLLGGEDNRLLRLLLVANAALLVWRLAVAACFTAAAYGPAEGLRAIPRTIVANFINALAAARAIGRYRQSLLDGGRPTWEKTDHRFPPADEVPHHG